MWARFGGLIAFTAAAIWPIGRTMLPEFARSVIYDRLLSMLGPLFGTYGPSVVLIGIGLYLFWRSGHYSSRFRNATVATGSQTLPMHEVVARVAALITDNDPAKFWPATRRVIRQAALDGDVQIYGHKSEDTGGSFRTSWSLVTSPIPRTYWELADITEVATSAEHAEELMHNTRPHQLSDGRFTNEKIEYYAKLTAKRDDIRRKWP